jgi:hypothetical protein
MPRFHGHRARFAHRGYPLSGAIWMIGIGVLMLWGHWWPGILVLIGISMFLGAFWKESTPQTFEDVGASTVPPTPTASVPPVVTIQTVPPAPVSAGHRLDLLPANCPHCGGPVRSHDVKWTGPQSASCPYCGSTLPMKKS